MSINMKIEANIKQNIIGATILKTGENLYNRFKINNIKVFVNNPTKNLLLTNDGIIKK